MKKNYVTLEEVCVKGGSNIAQKDLEKNEGRYPIYGASGFIKNVDFYVQDKPYIAVVKDGAGIGRTMMLPAYSSVIGTMQYLLPNDNIDISYLYYAVTAMNLAKYYTGATIPHIYFKDYRKEKLPLVDKLEQKKIVEVLSKIDALVICHNRQLDDFEVLVKSRFIEMFGNPKDNPKRFKSIRIGELTDVLTGSTPNRSNKDYYEGKIPWVKTGEIHPGYINSTEECISEVALKETTCKLLPVDTVMIAMYGQGKTRGQSGILGIKAATNQACAAILPCEKLNPVFLNQYLVIEYSRLRDMGRGAQQANLNLSMIKNYHILSIPIELQNQFADFVAQVNKSKLGVQKSLEELETLKKSLMQQYFGW